jgi:hypothetical protein
MELMAAATDASQFLIYLSLRFLKPIAGRRTAHGGGNPRFRRGARELETQRAARICRRQVVLW